MGLKFYDLAALPHQYDIVWCLYPQREQALAPGPVARPCLVLDVRADLENSRAALVIAYGTGQLEEAIRGGDLIIDDWEEVRALGLHKPTRFALSVKSRMCLPWCVEYFIPPSYVAAARVVLGALTPEQIERLTTCLSKQGLKPYTTD
jgi:hypothetical protein